jgi:hypothetical protein
MSIVYGDDDFLLAAAAAQHGINLDSRTGQDEVVGVKITRWRDMPAVERSAAWDELRDFVEWITTRYELTDNIIPTCWYQHPPLVEELSALRAAWDASFIVETDGGLGPISWHERFALACPRLKEAYRGECKRGGHVDNPTVAPSLDQNSWDAWRSHA